MRYTVLVACILLLSCSRPAQEQQGQRLSSTVVAAPAGLADPAGFVGWYSMLLDPLRLTRDSGLAAIRVANESLVCDTAVAMFRSRCSADISTINDSLTSNDRFLDWLQEDTLAQSTLDAITRTVGCSLLSTEGLYYIDLSSADLLGHVRDHCSPAMENFLTLRGVEEEQGFSDDAALVITWDVLSDRVANWETLIAADSSFLLLPEAEWRKDMYLETYLTGMDNAPIYDFEKATLDPEVRRSYERFIDRYPTHASARLVRAYLDLLTKEGFRETDAVKAFLKEKGIGSMMGTQPPTR
jgi:hypothetical protein